MEGQAVPLCLPNNCSWDPHTGEYSQREEQDRENLWVICKAMERLRQIKGPVCVVSIAGPCRKGKSYILSKAFDQGEVFPLGHSLDPETMGIWMWIVPEKYKDQNGQEFTVVLLDSEGIDAVTGEKTDDHRIFTLTVLLASVLIYNSAGVPTRKDLEDLDFIVKLSQRVRMGSQGESEADVNLLHKTFPFFMWLLRDVVLEVPKSCSDIKDYFLKRVFKSPKAQTGSDEKDTATQAAESILSFFPGFDAFKLPPPSTDPKVTQNMNSAGADGVNKEFLKGVDEFSANLKQRLIPKRSFTDGELVTGEALAAMAELYVDALNTPGTVPNIKSTWETFVQNKCTEATNAAFGLYNDIMTSQVKDLLPCDSDELRRSHQDALERGLALFEEETRGISAIHVNAYLTDWKDKAEENLSIWQQKNDRATEDFCVDLLQSLKKQHLEPVLAQLISSEGAKVTFTEIIEAYSAIETGFKNQAKGAKDVCARAFFNFHPELKAEMEKHVDHLQQLKDYDEKLAQQRAARAADEEKRRRMEEENKRLEQERKRKEREMELLKEKQEEDRIRLEEQFRENMETQREQMRNMMTANMEQIKQDREAMLSQNKTLEEALERMNKSMVSRNAEIQRLQEQITILASRPPPQVEESGGCVIL